MKLKLLPFGPKQGLGLSLILVGIAGLLTFRFFYLIHSEEMTSWTRDTEAECALVLTGGPNRVREGFALLSRKQVQRLIISGVNPSTELRDLMNPWDLIWGPDLEKITLEKRSTTTYGNAQQTLPIIEGLGCRRVALITSQLHMYRAFRTLRAAFPPNIEIIKHAVPPASSEVNFWEEFTELIKAVFYSLWAF